MKTLEKNVFPTKTLVDKDAYKFYMANKKYNHPYFYKGHKRYIEAVRLIYKKIAEGTIEYEGGVYSKGHFYTTVFPTIKDYLYYPVIEKGGIDYKKNEAPDKKLHSIGYINLRREIKYRYWMLEGSVSEYIKKKLKEKIKSRVYKYIFSLSTLLKLNLDD